MASKITIAIIGAETPLGSEVAAILALSGNHLLLIAAEPGSLDLLFANMANQHPAVSAELVDCLRDACWEADIIILVAQSELFANLATRFKEVATQKIVVLVLSEHGLSNLNNAQQEMSLEIKKILPDSYLVLASVPLTRLINQYARLQQHDKVNPGTAGNPPVKDGLANNSGSTEQEDHPLLEGKGMGFESTGARVSPPRQTSSIRIFIFGENQEATILIQHLFQQDKSW